MATARSTPSLFGDAIAQMGDLFRIELRLFRTEIDEKVSQATRSVVFVAVGGVLLLAAILVLLGAAVDWVASLGLERYWAGVIVGLVIAVLGGIFLIKAMSDLKFSKLKPSRTLDQVQKGFALVKSQVK